MSKNIFPIVNSLNIVNNKITNITSKIKFGWLYDENEFNYANATTISMLNDVLIKTNLNKVLEPVIIKWSLTYDTKLKEALNNKEIKYYLHSFGSTKTQYLQTNFFIKYPNIKIFNSYSTSEILNDRFNLLRFWSNDGILMKLIKEYLRDPYETNIDQTANMKYIILTDENYINPIFVNSYIKKIKINLNKINVSNDQIYELTFQQIQNNNLLLLNLLNNPTSSILFYIASTIDPIVSILINNNIKVGFYAADSLRFELLSEQTINYLKDMYISNSNYPQYKITNAWYDIDFVNEVGNGDSLAEWLRNMISFIIYDYLVNPSIEDNYIDQRYFTNKDNIFSSYNLTRIINSNNFEIVKRCIIGDSQLKKGGYTIFTAGTILNDTI